MVNKFTPSSRYDMTKENIDNLFIKDMALWQRVMNYLQQGNKRITEENLLEEFSKAVFDMGVDIRKILGLDETSDISKSPVSDIVGIQAIQNNVPQSTNTIIDPQAKVKRIKELVDSENLRDALIQLNEDPKLFLELTDTEQNSIAEHIYHGSSSATNMTIKGILNSNNHTSIKFILLSLKGATDITDFLSEIGECFMLGDTLIISCACQLLMKSITTDSLDISPILDKIIKALSIEPEKKIGGLSMIEGADLADFMRIMSNETKYEEGGAIVTLLLRAIKNDFPFGMKLIPYLDTLIAEKNEISLWRTILLIGHLGQNGVRMSNERYDDLLKLLQHKNPEIRGNAGTSILWMSQAGTDIMSGMSEYVKLLADSDSGVRLSGVTLFFLFVNREVDITSNIHQLVTLLRDKDDNVRGITTKTFWCLAAKNGDISHAVPSLRIILEDDDEEEKIRIDALNALYVFGKNTNNDKVLSIIEPYIE